MDSNVGKSPFFQVVQTVPKWVLYDIDMGHSIPMRK